MFYETTAVTVTPGKRLQARAHLSKLAKHVCDVYGIQSEAVENSYGPIYRAYIVNKFDSVAQAHEVGGKLFSSDFFNEWFKDSIDMMRWQDARADLFEILP